METENQDILQQAQGRLLKKREALKATGNHTPLMQSIDLDGLINSAKEKQKEFMQKHQTEPPVVAEKPTTQKRPQLDLPKRYQECTFDNFKGNEKLIIDVKRSLTERESLFITGKTGCGKTHLAAAIVKEIPTESRFVGPWNNERMIDGTLFITAPELLLKARSAFRENAKTTEEEIIDQYSGCELLCLDDLGAEKTTEYAITTLYLIIDRRNRDEMQTIITSNLTLEEIEATLGARIASRLAEMKIIKINMPDYRKKR